MPGAQRNQNPAGSITVHLFIHTCTLTKYLSPTQTFEIQALTQAATFSTKRGSTHTYTHTQAAVTVWADLPAVSHLFVLCCTWGHLSSQTDLFRSVWITTSATVRQSLKLSWDTPLVHVCLKLCAYVWMCKAEEQTEGKGSRWLGHSVRFGNANVSLFWISSYDLWSHHWIRQPGFTVEEEIENR